MTRVFEPDKGIILRKLIIWLLLLTSATVGFSDDLDTRIRSGAKKIAAAILAQDWDTRSGKG